MTEPVLIDLEERKRVLEREAMARFEARVVELKALQDGWYDGTGQALDAAHVDAVADFLRKLVAQHVLPVPSLYPTEDGGVQAEWSLPGWNPPVAVEWELSIEFPRSTGYGYFHATKLGAGWWVETQLDLSSDLKSVGLVAFQVTKHKMMEAR